jgi:Uncharacterized protein conserved in bacteria
MRITVAVALPTRQEVLELELADGSDVEAALVAARVAERWPDSTWSAAKWESGLA